MRTSSIRFVFRRFALAILFLSITEVAAQNFWEPTNLLPYEGTISALAINSRGHIFAGTDQSGVFRSIDNGNTWIPVNFGLANYRIQALVINPVTEDVFIGTVGEGGVFRSSDNGDSWTPVYGDLTNADVRAFAVNPVTRDIFAGTYNERVFRSSDNGASWTPVTGFPNTPVLSLAINSRGHIFAGTLFGGAFRSTNNGNSWTQINNGLTTFVLCLAINSNGYIFAGTNGGGLFRSINNGNSWIPVKTGLTATVFQALAINSRGHIFAGTFGGGVVRSIDNGDSWTIANAGLTNIRIQSLAISTTDDIFAGTYGGGMFRSTDNGNNWEPANAGLTDIEVPSLAISSRRHIFAGIFLDGVFRSLDNGYTWTPVNRGLTNHDVKSLVINSSGHIFAGTFGGGVYRSIDNGENWASSDIGLTFSDIQALAISPATQAIFAGTFAGVFRSTDNGNNWRAFNNGLGTTLISSLAISSAGHVFAVSFVARGGVFRSTDNGLNWMPANRGLTNTRVQALAIHPSGDIFAGTDSAGVFRSMDNGDSWMPLNTGLTIRNVQSFAINLVGHIFAGTEGGGVFRSIDNGNSWMPVNSGLTNTNVRSIAINSSGQVFAGTSGPGGGVFRAVGQPPSVVHAPPSPQQANQKIVIEARITDNVSINRAKLYYRRGGDANFISVLMSPNGDFYQAAIKADSVTSRGAEYFMIATDNEGFNSRLPELGFFSASVRIGGQGELNRDLQGKAVPQIYGSEQTAYRLISLPLDLDNKAPKAALEDDLGSYNIKQWRFYELGADQKLHEFPKTAEMQPGKAFWLIVRESGKVIDTGSGTSNRTDKKYEIPLHPMWNLIGNPFNFTIPVDSLHLKSGRQVELRTFTGSWNEPDSNPVTALQPFEGYAIFVDSADTILVNPDLSTLPNSLSKVTIPTPSNQLLWSIRILAQCQEARDEDNVAGVVANVSNNWDETNYPEPPTIGEYVSVYFSHPEWGRLSESYCTDFRPESSDGYVWPLAVATNIRDKVHLTFEGLESVPEENEIWLIDEVVPVAQNLRQNQSYVVAASSPEHPKCLKLVVGKHEFVEEKITNTQIIPTTYELNQNFPNPFNPATTIRYGLPQAERVTLKIYNLLGEEVATLLDNELQAAGYHVAIWDGRNKLVEVVGSGVYIYRFRAGGFTAIKKMALVK